MAEIGDISTLSNEERVKYDESLKNFRDNIAVYNSAKKLGEEEGMAKGRVEEKKSIALNLKRAGASIQMIATATGLSEAEIEALQ